MAQVRLSNLAFVFFLLFDFHADTCLLSVRQDAEGLPVEVKVRNKGDGLYSCSYLPASPIKHTLAITWGGVSIPNSPFRVSSQSQHLVTAGDENLPRAPNSAQEVQSEFLFKAERIEIVQSDSTKTFQARTKDPQTPKKPVIIIVTYTEEKYSF